MAFNLIVSFIKSNWRVIAVFLLVGAIYGLGRYHGAESVRADWQEEKNKQIIAESAMKEEWQKKSAEYQKELADLNKRIQSSRREVQDAIRKNYSNCVADDNLVRLWQGSISGKPASR